ncbi:MAG: hypothetical protein KGI69_01935 [Patescibacteria group bacterium]|nr:hypothetical protein [Patescibacteria group bacterium]
MIVYAASSIDPVAFGKVVDPIIANIVDPIIELIFAVALIAFIYGILQMVTHGTDSDAHQRGRMSMLSGVIGMFIMMSAWGIINIVAGTVGQF